MIGFIKKLFKPKPDADFDMLIKAGAIIVDVRSPAEYAKGHFKGSANIPIDKLPGELSKIKKDTPLILCCATGVRSSVACNTLLSLGYTQVYDGGIWTSLKQYENEYRAQL